MPCCLAALYTRCEKPGKCLGRPHAATSNAVIPCPRNHHHHRVAHTFSHKTHMLTTHALKPRVQLVGLEMMQQEARTCDTLRRPCGRPTSHVHGPMALNPQPTTAVVSTVCGSCWLSEDAGSTKHARNAPSHCICLTRVVHQHPTRWHAYHCRAPCICWPFKHPAAQTSLSTLLPIQTALWPGLHVATPNTQNSAARHTQTHAHADSCDGSHHQQLPPHHSKKHQRQHVTLS